MTIYGLMPTPVIGFDVQEIPEGRYPAWIDQQYWKIKEVAPGRYQFKNINTGHMMTKFNYYLLCGVHETHKRVDGVSRPYSWHEYDDKFMGVAMVSDYSGTSFSKRAIFECLKEDLEVTYPPKFDVITEDSKNDWSILGWQYNGEQIILKVLDDNHEPSKIAKWFFVDSQYHLMLEEICELEDKFDKGSLDNFFSEYYQHNGKGITYVTIDPDTHKQVSRIEDYKGGIHTDPVPPFKILSQKFQVKYNEIIFENFTEMAGDSATWNYTDLLADEWKMTDHMKQIFELLNSMNLIEVRDYSGEITFVAEQFAMPYALLKLGFTSFTDEDIEEDYDDESYSGHWGLHIFKVFDLVGESHHKEFIQYVVDNYDRWSKEVWEENRKANYATQLFEIIKRAYEDYRD